MRVCGFNMHLLLALVSTLLCHSKAAAFVSSSNVLPKTNLLMVFQKTGVDENPVLGQGTYYLACNSLYFISELEATLPEAKAECCRRNMSLLAVETDEEHDCIATNIFKSKYGNYYTDTERVNFWTSGTDAAVEGAFHWCYPRGRSQPLVAGSRIKWASTKPSIANVKENCVYAKNVIGADGATDSRIQLYDDDCAASHHYICETPTSEPNPQPQCPPEAAPEPLSVAMVRGAKTALDTTAEPIFTVPLLNYKFFKACDILYMYQPKPFNFKQSIAECTKYGGKAVSFETMAELDCLVQFNKDNGDFLASDFWTSASNLGPLTAARYKWCGSGAVLDDLSVWDATIAQPNLYWKERCAYCSIGAARSAIGLYDHQCTNTYHLLCEL